MTQRHQVDVETPALERFLAEPVARPMTDERALSFLREALGPIEPDPEPLPAETLRQRVVDCWRLARGIALVLGVCAEDEPLERAADAEDAGESPWTFPTRPKLSASQQQLVRLGEATDMHRIAARGVTLLPPADRHLAATWCAVASVLADELRLRPEPGLLDPRTCGGAGVSPKMVAALEELMVDEAGRSILECGERATTEHFRDKYGLARREAVGLVRLARADAMRMGGSSVEEDRALMVLQLKDLAGRCREEMNTDKELRVLKELARVQGLTRSEPEDLGRLFAGVIAGVADRQDRRQLESQRKVIDVTAEPVVESGDEDPAALAEFDREER
jgi:hypothetical protein